MAVMAGTPEPAIPSDGGERLALPPWHQWWPILLGPATMLVVYASKALGWQAFFGRGFQDNTPLPYVITLAAFAVALTRAVAGRNPLLLMLAAMALAIFDREVHWFVELPGGRSFSPCSALAYATLAICVFISWKRYDRIGPHLRRGRIAQWLIMTAATYIFAVAIAKGWLKALVYDDDFIRDYLEETLENVAHLMLLATAFTGRTFGASGGGGARSLRCEE